MNQSIDGIAAGESDRASLARHVDTLLAQLQPNVVRERRRDERVAIPVLLRLTPLDAGREPIAHEATIVVGKNISRRGLCFFHEHAISHRRALIELVQSGLGEFAAEIDVTWCRFTMPGWYESGGRLVRAVVSDPERATGELPVAEVSQFASFFKGCHPIATT